MSHGSIVESTQKSRADLVLTARVPIVRQRRGGITHDAVQKGIPAAVNKNVFDFDKWRRTTITNVQMIEGMT